MDFRFQIFFCLCAECGEPNLDFCQCRYLDLMQFFSLILRKLSLSLFAFQGQEIVIQWVFLKFTENVLAEQQLRRWLNSSFIVFSRSCRELEEQRRVVSSANVLIFAFSKHLGMSFIYIKKQKWAKGRTTLDRKWVSTSTYCVLLSRQLLNHCRGTPRIPYLYNFCSRI